MQRPVDARDGDFGSEFERMPGDVVDDEEVDEVEAEVGIS